MRKKLFAILMSAMMMVSFMPAMAFAGENGPVAEIDEQSYETLAAAVEAANAGDTVEIITAGTYKIPNIPNNITIKGTVDGIVFDCVGSGSIASIPNGATFENVTMNFGQSNYHGFQHAGTINMKSCVLNGLFFSYGDMNFDGCTFNAPGTEYSMWCYAGNITYTNCIANCAGKFANVYNEGNGTWSVKAEGCTFNSTKANKAALNVKENCCNGEELHFDITVKNCTANGSWPTASGNDNSILLVINEFVQIDDRNASTIANSKAGNGVKVTIGDTVAYPATAEEPTTSKPVQPVPVAPNTEKGIDDAIVSAMTMNEAVNNFENTNLGSALKTSVGEEVNLSIKFELKSAKAENQAEGTAFLKFDVKPYANENEISNEQLNGTPITFRLPLTANFNDVKVVKVIHHAATGINEKHYAVKGNDGARYVEITTPSFSTFDVLGTQLEEVPTVAQIGDTKYETLAEAIAAVPTNGTKTTVTLLTDIEDNIENDAYVTISERRNVDLDMNGHTIAIKSCNKGPFVVDGGTLELSGTGTVKNTYDKDVDGGTDDGFYIVKLVTAPENNKQAAYSVFTQGKDVVLNGMDYVVNINKVSEQKYNYGAVANLNGKCTAKNTVVYVNGYIHNTEYAPIINFGSTAKIENKNYIAGYAVVNVADGATFTSESNCFNIAAGELNINGGLFTGGNTAGHVASSGGSIDYETCCTVFVKQHSTNLQLTVNIKDGGFKSYVPFCQEKGQATTPAPEKVTLNISGGKFLSTATENPTAVKSADKSGFITGGLYSDKLDTNYLAKNCDAAEVDNATYKYIVGLGAVSTNGKLTAGKFTTNPSEYVAAGYTVNYTSGAEYPYEVVLAPTPIPDSDPQPEVIEDKTSIDVSKETEVKTDESGVVEAKTELSEKVAESIVETAKKSESEEVVIAAVAETKPTEEVTKAEVSIPVKAIEELSKVESVQTVVIQTNVAEIALDKKTAEEIAKQAPEGATIIVEAVREDEKSDEVAQDVYELKIIAVQSGTKTEIGDFKGGKVTVKVDIPEGLTGKKVACLYRDNNGKYTRRAVTKQDDAKGFFSFTTNHFSDYVVTEENTAKTMLVNQTEENQKKLKNYANGKIKVSFDKVTYDTELGKRVQTYQIYRSTKKNSGFKKVGTVTNKKKSTKTITFTNAKKLKKGKKYYYKVRGRVQLANGKYAYTQWSNVRYAKCKKSR